jgi:predicted nucleotidyltransferase
MNSREVIQTLQTEQATLQAMGVASLALFGSIARGEETEESDIDLVACFDEATRLSILKIIGVENYLTDLFHRPVQITSEPVRKPRLARNIARDRRDIF